MSKKRDISVITCVWNQCERFFTECATSVAALSADIEWIIADDGSSNDAAESYRKIADAVAGNVPVQFIRLPQRSGLSRARNAALANAAGEWIVVLDSDDRLTLNLDSVLVGLPCHVGLVALEARYFSHDTTEHRRIRHFERLFRSYGGTTLDPFLWFDFYYHGIIARNEVLRRIGGYLDECDVGEDQDILFRAVESLRRDQVRFIHQVGYEYRNNPDGVCGQQWEAVRDKYTATMLAAVRRRGAKFHDCRFVGVKEIDGSQIDQYEYRSSNGTWLSWEQCQAEFQETKESAHDTGS